jgi:tetratricopeptide (TPR) repeat protein
MYYMDPSNHCYAFLGKYMKDELSQAYGLYQKGRLMMEEGKLDEATVLFQHSIELSPHFKALELLGECFLRLNQLREAVVPLAAATALNKGVRVPSLLAEVFLQLKDYQAAEEVAEVALSRDSNNRKALEVKKVAAELKGMA